MKSVTHERERKRQNQGFGVFPKIKKVSQKQGLKWGPDLSDFFFISACGYPHANLARCEINPPVRGVLEVWRVPY